jgi:hypothetical protein
MDAQRASEPLPVPRPAEERESLLTELSDRLERAAAEVGIRMES